MLSPGVLEAGICQRWNVTAVAGRQFRTAGGAPCASYGDAGQGNPGCPAGQPQSASRWGAGPVESRSTNSGSITISRPAGLPRTDSGTSISNTRWPI